MSLEQHGWFKKKGWKHNIDHRCPRIISSTPPQPHRALDECGCGFPLHLKGRRNPRWRAWWETQYTDRHVSCHMYLNRHAGLKRVDTYLMPSAVPPLYRIAAHLISLPKLLLSIALETETLLCLSDWLRIWKGYTEATGMATVGRNMAAPLLFLNLILYILVVGFGSWCLNRLINGQTKNPG